MTDFGIELFLCNKRHLQVGTEESLTKLENTSFKAPLSVGTGLMLAFLNTGAMGLVSVSVIGNNGKRSCNFCDGIVY